jgi:hypothetical protein
MTAKAGDRIVVESPNVGQAAREGETLEVAASTFCIRYEVRWADGHVSIFKSERWNRPNRRGTEAPAAIRRSPGPGTLRLVSEHVAEAGRDRREPKEELAAGPRADPRPTDEPIRRSCP